MEDTEKATSTGADRAHDNGTSGSQASHHRPRWASLALLIAGIWSVAQLSIAIVWLLAPNALQDNAFANPYDQAVDRAGAATSLLTQLEPGQSALVLAVLGAVGVLLIALMAVAPPATGGGRSWWRTVVTVIVATQAGILALLVPDYRLIATIAYTPVVAIQQLVGAGPRVTVAELYTATTVSMMLATLAGIAFAVTAVAFDRRMRAACRQCGRSARPARWTTATVAARWGRWMTVIAIIIPVGYAVTRWAWAWGIPLGVSDNLLDELGSYVWMGAALGTMAVGGAVLTAGLIRPWGEVFPRWIPGLRGRRVPISLAVAPALTVAVIVASAGLMFVRMAATGQLDNNFPGSVGDVAAWLPEMFWPIWGVALAGASVAYWLRRRGSCQRCGSLLLWCGGLRK